MSDQNELLSGKNEQSLINGQVLSIEKVVGGYAGSLGLQKGDIIAGIDGVPFFGTKSEFNALFDFDEDSDDGKLFDAIVLTVGRGGIFFNVVAHMRVLCSFKQIDAPFEELPENFQKMLLQAESPELAEYLIFYDNSKNAELLLSTRSLIAMVAPPFWLLNHRMPEAAAATTLALVLSFVVSPILGAIFYCVLCLYVGREQMNLAMSFMSFKKMIFKQQIAAVSELEAQKTAIEIDEELFFLRPAEGLEQQKRKRVKAKLKATKPKVEDKEALV